MFKVKSGTPYSSTCPSFAAPPADGASKVQFQAILPFSVTDLKNGVYGITKSEYGVIKNKWIILPQNRVQ